jgi:hypothetical protein
MPTLFSKICDPEHLLIIILVLILALIATGAGRGIGTLINTFLKKMLGGSEKDVSINIGSAAVAGDKTLPRECEGCGLIVDPTKCVMHQSEHERSKRNEAAIVKLWEEYGKLRNENLAAAAKLKDEMISGFDKVNSAIHTSNTQILGALAGSRNGFGKAGRGGEE